MSAKGTDVRLRAGVYETWSHLAPEREHPRNGDTIEKYSPDQARDDHGRWRDTGGAPWSHVALHERSLPTMAKAAGELIVRNLESQRERESLQRDLADPKQQAKVVRNWAKTLKDKRGREIDEPVRGELLLAGESGEQLTSEGQRLPSRR